MTTDSIKLYKLIVLYFLDRANGQITNAILSDFILSNNYTNYFSFQEILAALTADDMVCAQKTQSASYYQLTKNGKNTLDAFYDQLPRDTIGQIDEYLRAHRIAIARETAVQTDYRMIAPGEYIAECSVTERNRKLLTVSLSFPTEDAAENACRRFKEKNAEIYAYLIKNLSAE